MKTKCLFAGSTAHVAQPFLMLKLSDSCVVKQEEKRGSHQNIRQLNLPSHWTAGLVSTFRDSAAQSDLLEIEFTGEGSAAILFLVFFLRRVACCLWFCVFSYILCVCV